MSSPRLERLTAEPSSGRQLRTLAHGLLWAAALAAVLLITGGWSHVVEGTRSGRNVGWSVGAAKPVWATDARQLSTGTSARPADAVGAAALTVPVACTAEAQSLGASWPSAVDLAGALAARPSWITKDPSPIQSQETAQSLSRTRSATPHECTDGYFDSWSQTWFTLTATPIAAVSPCVIPSRRST